MIRLPIVVACSFTALNVLDMSKSSHLEFLPETRPDTSTFDTILAQPDLPPEVRSYYQSEIDKADESIKTAHSINAYRLAERVVYKYRKWGKSRFGVTPETQLDFYDGSPKINSPENPITFDLVFEGHLRDIAKDDFLIIRNNLHLGNSAQRFRAYISCKIGSSLKEHVYNPVSTAIKTGFKELGNIYPEPIWFPNQIGSYIWKFSLPEGQSGSTYEYSPRFMIGARNWQFMIFPKGNPNFNTPNCVAIFFQMAVFDSLYNINDAVKLDFKLALMPPPGSGLRKTWRGCTHTFHAGDIDRGFNDMVLASQIQQYTHEDGNLWLQIITGSPN